eukprot:4268035-Amphidinium_carterae.1
MEASEDVSMPQQAQAYAGQAEENSEVRRPLEFCYLHQMVAKIPLAANSFWARSQAEWPVMGRENLTLEHAAAVRQLLADSLAAIAESTTGAQQWSYEAQDCFDGREGHAKTEGNMAEASCTWICQGDPKIPLYALQDFFPADPAKYIHLSLSKEQKLLVPYYGGLRWRKLARALAGADSTRPPTYEQLELVSYDEMCEDLAAFGLSASTARHGTMQHFGAYIIDMLHSIYAAEVGI